jgi:hypothetical protein
MNSRDFMNSRIIWCMLSQRTGMLTRANWVAGQVIEMDCRIHMNPNRCFPRILYGGQLTCGALATLSKTVRRVLLEVRNLWWPCPP